jgi:hypothetical protein
MKLRGLVLNLHSHVSVNGFYIPMIGPLILLQQNKRPILGIHEYMNVGIGNEATQFNFWEY